MLISDSSSIGYMITDDQKAELNQYGFVLHRDINLSRETCQSLEQQIVANAPDIATHLAQLKPVEFEEPKVKLLLLVLLCDENFIYSLQTDPTFISKSDLLNYTYTLYCGLDDEQRKSLRRQYLDLSTRKNLAKRIIHSLDSSLNYVHDQDFIKIELIRHLVALCQKSFQCPLNIDLGSTTIHKNYKKDIIETLNRLRYSDKFLQQYPEYHRLMDIMIWLGTNNQFFDNFEENIESYSNVISSAMMLETYVNNQLNNATDNPQVLKARDGFNRTIDNFYTINNDIIKMLPELHSLYRQLYMDHQEKDRRNQKITTHESYSLTENNSPMFVKKIYDHGSDSFIYVQIPLDRKSQEYEFHRVSPKVVSVTQDNFYLGLIRNATKQFKRLTKQLTGFLESVTEYDQYITDLKNQISTLGITCSDLDKKICDQLHASIFNWNTDKSQNLHLFDIMSKSLNQDKIAYFKQYMEYNYHYRPRDSVDKMRSAFLSGMVPENQKYIAEFEQDLMDLTPYFCQEIHHRFENYNYYNDLFPNQLYQSVLKCFYHFIYNENNEYAHRDYRYEETTNEQLNVFLNKFDIGLHYFDQTHSMVFLLGAVVEDVYGLHDLFNDDWQNHIFSIIGQNQLDEHIEEISNNNWVFIGHKDHPPELNFSKKQLKDFLENTNRDKDYLEIITREWQQFLGVNWQHADSYSKNLIDGFVAFRTNLLRFHAQRMMEFQDFKYFQFFPRNWKIVFVHRGQHYLYDPTNLELQIHGVNLVDNQLQYLIGYSTPISAQQAKIFESQTSILQLDDPLIQEQSTTTPLMASNPHVNNCITGLQLLKEIQL